MTIERPYGADNNDVNMLQVRTIQKWANKNNEIVDKLLVYKLGVLAEMESGRKIRMIITDGFGGSLRSISKYLIMYEDTTGKSKRIKKAEW